MNKLKRALFFSTPWKKPAIHGDAEAAGTESPQAAATFITPSSLATFAGATAAVIALSTFAGFLVPYLKDERPKIYLIAALAGLVAVVMFLVSVEDASSRPKSRGQWAIAILVALVNYAYLTSAALGIPLAVDKANQAQIEQKQDVDQKTGKP